MAARRVDGVSPVPSVFGLAKRPKPHARAARAPRGTRRVFVPTPLRGGASRRGHRPIRSLPVRAPPVPSARSRPSSRPARSEKRELVRASRTRAAVVRAARRRGRAAYEASVGQPEMATPGASRQPLACTRLPHKRPTSLGALPASPWRWWPCVPRAVPARRLRTSLHLRRAPRRAWTRRGAAPRFSRRLRTPNSLYFMAELTERCGVCAKCQWTCADQPEQPACWMCQNGGGRCYFQHQPGSLDLALRESAAGHQRCGGCAACQWTCADQPNSGLLVLSKRAWEVSVPT